MPRIVLSSLDYDNLISELEVIVPKIIADWDFTDLNDLGRIVTEIATALAVENNYIGNRWVNEAFIQTATDPYNIYLLAAYKAYLARTSQSSLVKIKITLQTPAVSTITINPYTIQITNSGEQPVKKFYENRDTIVFSPGDITKEVVFISGQSKSTVFISDGLDFSSYEILDNPVILDIGSGFDNNYGLVVTTTAGTWKLVYDFLFSESSDLNFTITPTNYGTIKITFADNNNGAKPAIGENITVNYRIGGGAASVDAFAIDTVVISPTIAGNSINTVVNENKEYSGADAEDPKYTQRAAPVLGFSRSKIMDEDVIALYVEGVPGIARAKVLFISNIINIVAIPTGLGQVGQDTLNLITQAVKDKIARGYSFEVSNPIYKETTINIDLYTVSAYKKTDVYRTGLNFINNFLNPLYKDPTTQKYLNNFGGSFSLSDFGFRLKQIQSIYDYALITPSTDITLNPTEILIDTHTRPSLSIITSNGTFIISAGIFTSLSKFIKILIQYSGTTTTSSLVDSLPTNITYTLNIGSNTGQDTFAFLKKYINTDPLLAKSAGYTFGDGSQTLDSIILLTANYTETSIGSGNTSNPTPTMDQSLSLLDPTGCTFLDINVVGGS
jgi:hypothetical protein